nr:phosphoenolpyruvate carboxykinase (ATP) [Salisediminibacterium beveridgei]
MIHFETSLRQLLMKDTVAKDLSVPQLIERSLYREEGLLTNSGAFLATTGVYTGRSPKDRFIVDEPETRQKIDWNDVNQPIQPEIFDRLYEKVMKHLEEKEELFTRHCVAGADQAFELPIRVINELAWHNLFVRQLFLRPETGDSDLQHPEFTIISAPSFKAHPETDGTNSEAFVMISFERKTVLIGGTAYAGEMKKSIFSIMNYFLPQKNVLPMHCSANVGIEGDTALFFGLSGTGKTTLSADPERLLIGDDEHGWSNRGIFNIEGGCYAKTIALSKEKEPAIFDAIRFGSVLENVLIDDQSRQPDYNSATLTENTRAAYPIDHIHNCQESGVAGHPSTLFFLTADASGVLPPVSKLTPAQAMYHFLTGYTSKLAGTERGITEPQPTFSTCFGAPFLPLNASVYAEMLGQKLIEHDAEVYLINTGWTGGGYGTGQRMNLTYTRAMIRAALNGDFNNVEMAEEPFFGLRMPTRCPGVPDDLLEPRSTWANGAEYDRQAEALAASFKDNFNRFGTMPEDILRGGPIQ